MWQELLLAIPAGAVKMNFFTSKEKLRLKKNQAKLKHFVVGVFLKLFSYGVSKLNVCQAQRSDSADETP